MSAAAPDTIVLVHGFWVTPRSWEHWIAHYEAKGYQVIAPAYPGFEVEVEALNKDDTPIVDLSIPEVVEKFEGRDRGPGPRADPDGPLRRRGDHPGADGPRLRGGRGRVELGADRGRADRAAVAGEVHLAGAEEPRQPPQGGGLHVRSVELRVHQRPAGRPGPRAVRALRTCRRPAGCCSTASRPTSSRARRTRRWTTRTTTARRCCSSRAARTTSCRRRSRSRTSSTTSRDTVTEITEYEGRAPDDRRPRAGRRSPTTCWSGRSSTPR